MKIPFKRSESLGLYPIVDSSSWLEKLLPLGVKIIQLRIKSLAKTLLIEEIKRSIILAKFYKATLIINDYWEEAINLGADGVHLGQEDINNADIEKIQSAGLFLGISTHNAAEVARASSFCPSYLACGPIYKTDSKEMPYEPQGVLQLQHWSETLDYPLVAIGGINLERLPEVLQTKVAGIAVISAITKAADPEKATKDFLIKIREYNDKL